MARGWDGRVSLDDVYSRDNPTLDDALGRLDRAEIVRRSQGRVREALPPPPPDNIWIPHLRQQGLSVGKIGRITGLSPYKVKQILASGGGS